MLVTAAIRDVSERRKADEQIKALNAELEEALRRSDRLATTGRLMASLVHEINNPLDSISNILFMLQAEANTSQHQQDCSPWRCVNWIASRPSPGKPWRRIAKPCSPLWCP